MQPGLQRIIWIHDRHLALAERENPHGEHLKGVLFAQSHHDMVQAEGAR